MFLFFRDYMDYHADRFSDHSLIAYLGDTPIALLPANIDNDTLYSHQGLTFGGWITDMSMKAATMLLLFEQLVLYMQAHGIQGLVYKSIPHIYHCMPAEEDSYALFRHNAELIQCDVTATIDYRNTPAFSERRKRGLIKAMKNGLQVRKSDNYAAYFAILESLLRDKYDSIPVHNMQEFLILAGKFPENIKLYVACKDDVMLAGVIIYESAHVAHAQYIAITENGRKCGALDIVFDYLIHHVYPHKRYFDFGTSNANQGRYLNEGLIGQKEEFGACAVVQRIYRITAA